MWVSLTYPFASRGHGLSIHYTCRLNRAIASRIKLGNSVSIKQDTLVNVVGPLAQNGEPAVVFDENVIIGARCLICAKNCIHIERDVMTAQSVLIADHSDAHEGGTSRACEPGVTEGGRIRIGQGSWIGRGAAIVCTRGELVLGRNCVVGANALITRSFPPYSVIGGNPARVVKQFDPVKGSWVLGSARFVEAELSE
jgi:acetyltransferase-like isoleucine patch superfamily enzyme